MVTSYARWTIGVAMAAMLAGCVAPPPRPTTYYQNRPYDDRAAYDDRGGYYDRAFEYLRDLERPSKPLLVGIGYALQEIERIEPRDWDVPLDYVATERELIDFTNPDT